MKNILITIDPEIMSGAPVFAGSRVTIKTLIDYLENGKTVRDFLQDFDWISEEQVHYVLELLGKSVSTSDFIKLLDESLA